MSLVRAAHARGIRVIGDLTINHIGDDHPWFERAGTKTPPSGASSGSTTASSTATRRGRASARCRSSTTGTELRHRLLGGAEAVVQRWLLPPFELDGWRLDVANMAGRRGDVDVARELAHAVRGAALDARADAVLVAEHAHDARSDLQGGGWHGTMAYMGFTRPVWAWLRGDVLPAELQLGFLGLPVEVPRLGGAAVTATMRRFRAGIPWRSVLSSWVLLDSHDTARFRVVSGSRERHVVGIGLQMTTPGVPMVFAGDEVGLEGAWGEDARRTMPWDRPGTWDAELLEAYRTLIGLRGSSRALARGGIRFAHVGRTRSRTSARRVTSGCSASPSARRPTTSAFRSPRSARPRWSRSSGGRRASSAGRAVLPGDGPAFHVWRLR